MSDLSEVATSEDCQGELLALMGLRLDAGVEMEARGTAELGAAVSRSEALTFRPSLFLRNQRPRYSPNTLFRFQTHLSATCHVFFENGQIPHPAA